MTRRNRISVGLAALLLLVAAFPVAGDAQVGERPRRSSQHYNRVYQVAFDEGYRVGYDKGEADARKKLRRSLEYFPEYRDADSGYYEAMGSRSDYIMGYRAGFERGYSDGQEGRQYGAQPGEEPVEISRDQGGQGPVLQRGDRDNYDPNSTGGPADPAADPAAASGSRRASFNTTMIIELETPITTRHSKEGDRFSARVVDPATYAGAKVDGYVGKIEQPGRVSGAGEVVLVFQKITYPDGYSEPLEAQVEEIIGYQQGAYRKPKRGILNRAPWEWGKDGGDRNEDIDAEAGGEGEIEGKSSRNRDVATVGSGAVAGAILGGIFGGGSGAAIGAVIGGAAGGGIVAATKGHHIDLEPGAQLRIRTGEPARH
jgi:hypothetical protein